VAAYGIDARSGALTRLAEYPAGGNANWIEIIDLPALPAVPVGVP